MAQSVRPPSGRSASGPLRPPGRDQPRADAVFRAAAAQAVSAIPLAMPRCGFPTGRASALMRSIRSSSRARGRAAGHEGQMRLVFVKTSFASGFSGISETAHPAAAGSSFAAVLHCMNSAPQVAQRDRTNLNSAISPRRVNDSVPDFLDLTTDQKLLDHFHPPSSMVRAGKLFTTLRTASSRVAVFRRAASSRSLLISAASSRTARTTSLAVAAACAGPVWSCHVFPSNRGPPRSAIRRSAAAFARANSSL